MIADLLRELGAVGAGADAMTKLERHQAPIISPVDLVLLLTRSA